MREMQNAEFRMRKGFFAFGVLRLAFCVLSLHRPSNSVASFAALSASVSAYW